MNRRAITVDPNQPIGKSFLLSILAGVGVGIGLLIMSKLDKKQLADKKAMEEASRLYRPPKKEIKKRG